jgi:hypothetical protein
MSSDHSKYRLDPHRLDEILADPVLQRFLAEVVDPGSPREALLLTEMAMTAPHPDPDVFLNAVLRAHNRAAAGLPPEEPQ